MKATILTTTAISIASFGFAVLPLHAEDTPAAPVKEAAEVVAANTIPVYIVQVSGKG